MVPLWATLLVGLGGGMLGTLLTIGHERGAELRTRMLTAADAYLQANMQMAAGVRGLRIALEAPTRPSQDVLERIRFEIQEVDDRLTQLLGPIVLLFGPASATSHWARETRDAQERLRLAFDAWEANEPLARDRVIDAVREVDARLLEFTLAARRDVRFGVVTAEIFRIRGRIQRT
jgi:hypothetical protein